MFDKKLVNFNKKTYADKFEVIQDLAHLENANVGDADVYAAAVTEREQVVPTYIGYGIAMPHAITPGVKKAFVIYQKLENGVKWDNEDVSDIFMIGVPKDGNTDAKQHLKIISELSKNLMREEFRNSLLNASDSDEVFELLKKIEEGMTL